MVDVLCELLAFELDSKYHYFIFQIIFFKNEYVKRLMYLLNKFPLQMLTCSKKKPPKKKNTKS